MGGARGHQSLESSQPRVAVEKIFDGRDNFVGLRHPSQTELATGHFAIIGADHGDSVAPQGGQVATRRGMVPHPHIHRRCNQDWFVGGKQRGGCEIGGKSGSELGEQIGGRRRDDHKIGGA